MTKSADFDTRPAPTLRAGVTGHRSHRVTPEVAALIAPRIASLLDALTRLAGTLRDRDPQFWRNIPPQLRLVGSLADGSDMLVAEQALARGWILDAILPFERRVFARMQAFDDASDARFHALCEAARPGALLELEGDDGDEANRREAYVAVGRRIVANADVLIAVWDGENGDPGGTSDVVRMALSAGVPVVRLSLEGEARLLLTTGDRRAPNAASPALSDAPGQPALSVELEAALLGQLAPPASEMVRRDLQAHLEEPTWTSTLWFAFDLLRWISAGRRMSIPVRVGPDEKTQAQWFAFLDRAETLGGRAFAETLRTRLEPSWRHADAVALRNSHAYRSAYVVNFVFAAMAVMSGLVSVIAWEHADALSIKAWCVGIELALIFTILLIIRRGGATGRDWHRRWLQARSAAELLRPARLALLLGRTDAPKRAAKGLSEATWVDWYVRAILREIGPPTALLDSAALRITIDAALEDELEGQVEYHARTGRSARALDHYLHRWGQRLFIGAFGAGLLFLLYVGAYSLSHQFEALHGVEMALHDVKPLVKSLTTVLGAGLPALGAALFGIRAMGDFQVAEAQAARTLEELEAIATELKSLREAPRRGAAAALFLRISQAEATDLRDWARVYSMRALALPG